MTPELLSLIKGWRERHPEAWPELVEIGSVDLIVKADFWTPPPDPDTEVALTLIESSVLDSLAGHLVELATSLGGKATARIGGPIQKRHYADTRLHALLLAVAEMEAQ